MPTTSAICSSWGVSDSKLDGLGPSTSWPATRSSAAARFTHGAAPNRSNPAWALSRWSTDSRRRRARRSRSPKQSSVRARSKGIGVRPCSSRAREKWASNSPSASSRPRQRSGGGPRPVVAGRRRLLVEKGQHPLRVARPADAEIGLDEVGSPGQRARMAEALAIGERRDPLQLADRALRAAEGQLEEAQRARGPSTAVHSMLYCVVSAIASVIVAARLLLEAEPRLDARERHERPAGERLLPGLARERDGLRRVGQGAAHRPVRWLSSALIVSAWARVAGALIVRADSTIRVMVARRLVVVAEPREREADVLGRCGRARVLLAAGCPRRGRSRRRASAVSPARTRLSASTTDANVSRMPPIGSASAMARSAVARAVSTGRPAPGARRTS